MRLLMLLAVLQAGCLLESEAPIEVAGKCGPRDLSPECCLKELPGQWERCTGVSTYSMGTRVIAAGVAVTVALNPVIDSAERRGVALAADLLAKVEKAIVQCVRKADQEVNDYHFNGRSPSREICQQVKVGEQTTWAAYLGLFKHEQARPCLEEVLSKLIPDRYRLHPRFRFDERSGKWEFLDENKVKQIVSEQGWKGLTGTIEPDIVLLDEKGFIVHVYDLKFPCPETNPARWELYKDGPWFGLTQGDRYHQALKVAPSLVSPRRGIEPWKQK
ncbi:hypothetical protein F0U61_24350 [Archangium violaceum]|uniref:hypothetical protein n=1 Tax=Archangium violaceum TaxID=83451 RepID=UPI002B2860B3|nr:hypothetical protein F0U61_24350 [Archangium violaceum]